MRQPWLTKSRRDDEYSLTRIVCYKARGETMGFWYVVVGIWLASLVGSFWFGYFVGRSER